jgi:hypothetical protein
MKDKPNWKCCFIENTIVTDKHKLQTVLSQHEFTIFIASDGEVYNYDGTFGVAISDGNSILAKNNGKFYSVDFCESSYRSELYSNHYALNTE